MIAATATDKRMMCARGLRFVTEDSFFTHIRAKGITVFKVFAVFTNRKP